MAKLNTSFEIMEAKIIELVSTTNSPSRTRDYLAELGCLREAFSLMQAGLSPEMGEMAAEEGLLDWDTTCKMWLLATDHSEFPV